MQGDERAAQLMTERVSQLQGQNLPFGTNLVEMAYYQLVSDGKIQQAGEQQQHNAPEITEEIVANAEKLSDKDLLALLQKNGMFR